MNKKNIVKIFIYHGIQTLVIINCLSSIQLCNVNYFFSLTPPDRISYILSNSYSVYQTRLLILHICTLTPFKTYINLVSLQSHFKVHYHQFISPLLKLAPIVSMKCCIIIKKTDLLNQLAVNPGPELLICSITDCIFDITSAIKGSLATNFSNLNCSLMAGSAMPTTRTTSMILSSARNFECPV